MSIDAPVEHSLVASALDREIDAAFDLLQAGFEQLLDISDRGDLCALGPERLIEVAQRFEAHRSRLQAIDTGIVEAAREERLDEHTCSRTLAIALSETLRISRPTAKSRVARAEQMMPKNAFSGVASAQLPVLADAARSGAVTADQVELIGQAMKRLRTNPQVGLDDLELAERALVEQSSALTPEQLRVVAAKIDDILLPDGVLPRDPIARERRGLRIGPERRDGTHSITGSLTRVAHARLMSVLSSLAAPRPATDELGLDPRTPEQRMHDALEDAMSRLLDTAGLPRSGGTPATVHVTIDVEQLRDAVAATRPSATDPAGTGPFAPDPSATGPGVADPGATWWSGPAARPRGTGWAPTRAAATTSFSDRITFQDLIQLAEQARIIPTYLSSTKGIVAYGAQRRCATEGQTQALIARDKGCSFPGCDAPPEWCERHHVIAWYRGGPTDLNNLTLLCGYHHREFEARGWTVVIYHGIPVWIPPRHIDPRQRPLISTRIDVRATATLDIGIDNAAEPNRLGKLDAAAVLAYGGVAERSMTTADSPHASESLDELDPIPKLTDLLALHIATEEREEFLYEVDMVLAGYLEPGTHAGRLHSVA